MATNQEKPKGNFRPALNAVRALASLWVVVYHFRYFSDYPWFNLFAVSKGYLGVDVFFILSGLVISHVYLESAKLSYGPLDHLSFLWKRVARLWPVHAAIMTAMLLVIISGGEKLDSQSLKDWFTLTFLVRQWLMPSAYAWNTPAWSISSEFFAYAFVFPAVVFLVHRLGAKGAAPILLLIGYSLVALMESLHGTVNVFSASGPIIRVIAGFTAGAGIFCVSSAIKPSSRWNVAVVLAIGGVVASLFGESDSLILLAFSLLLMALYKATGRAARFFSSKPFFRLGEWSYSLYLIHIPAFVVARTFAEHFNIERGPIFCLAALALSIVCSAAIYNLLEVPARTYLRSRSLVRRSLV